MKDLPTGKNTPESQTYEIPISGMNCAGCALSLETALNKLNLGKIAVSYTLESAFITSSQGTSPERFIKEIEKLGYKAGSFEAAETEKFKYYRLLFCLLVTVPLLFHGLLPLEFIYLPWVQLLAVTPVMLIGIWEFGASAIGSVRSLAPNMESLIMFGAAAAYIYSLIGFSLDLGHQYIFFETASSIITFMLIGSIVEHKAVARTASQLKQLLDLQPSSAKKVTSAIKPPGKTAIDHEFEIIDARLINSGDLLLVNQGDKIPADGIVDWGEGAANESMITGESNPVGKNPGTKVIGGSILVSGNIRIKATSIGEDSVLAQIVALVKKSQAVKPRIQKIGDQISAVFVPIILLLSLATFFFWFSLSNAPLGFQESFMRALSVLIIACPCAMGLATPLAIAVGLGKGANNGILIKDSAVFEELPRIKNFVFDKTGTLTTGEIDLARIDYVAGSRETTESIIKTLETHSSHPIARQLSEVFKHAATFSLKDVSELNGIGVRAQGEDGVRYAIGSEKILADKNQALPPAAAGAQAPNIYVTVEDRVIAAITTGEKIKPGAIEAINFLKNSGKKLYLLSGDSLERTLAVAAQVGIPAENVYGSKLPAEKTGFVSGLINDGKTCYIGDGINDSPSLSTANVGIAPGKGSDLAVNSAQVVILNEDLNSLIKICNLAAKTSRTIRQNLFWAFFYNIIAVPFAALGYLTPTLAALTMTLSDAVIVINSLLLKIKKI